MEAQTVQTEPLDLSKPKKAKMELTDSVDRLLDSALKVSEEGTERRDALCEEVRTAMSSDPSTSDAECKLPCDICGKGISDLEVHMRSHTDEKPWNSLICGGRLSQLPSFNTSTRKEPLKCPVCSKIFPFPSQLKTHMRTHTGEKPFSCSICNDSFSHSSNLKVHMKICTGEKSDKVYSCPSCNETFHGWSALSKHMTDYLTDGEASYICSMCGKSFAQSWILNRHMKAHYKKLLRTQKEFA